MEAVVDACEVQIERLYREIKENIKQVMDFGTENLTVRARRGGGN